MPSGNEDKMTIEITLGIMIIALIGIALFVIMLRNAIVLQHKVMMDMIEHQVRMELKQKQLETKNQEMYYEISEISSR